MTMPGMTNLGKLFSPRILSRTVMMLDKSTGIVVGTGWLVAVLTLIIAVMGVHSAVAARKLAADALIAEPVLPVATATAIDARETQVIVEKLQRQFPDLKIDSDSTHAITVRTEDGAKFHQWVTALSYIDTMAPQYRWGFKEFCVGHCTTDLMRAVISGQKVIFTLPPSSSP
jgi:hypothetical protein